MLSLSDTAPTFDAMPDQTISMDTAVGTTLFKVQANDADPADVPGLKVQMVTKNEFFKFNGQTGNVQFYNVIEKDITYAYIIRNSLHPCRC